MTLGYNNIFITPTRIHMNLIFNWFYIQGNEERFLQGLRRRDILQKNKLANNIFQRENINHTTTQRRKSNKRNSSWLQ